MRFRSAISYLEDVFVTCAVDEQDARDWLAGRDRAIRERANDRALAAVALVGGEVA